MTFRAKKDILNNMEKLIKKLLADKRVRFLFVGALNTLVGIGVTYIIYLASGYPIFSEADIPAEVKLLATFVGQAVGTIHSYIWNKFFTFRSNEKSIGEFLRFLIVNIVQYALNYALTLLFSCFISQAWLYTIIVTAICTVVSYIGHNFFSFRGKCKENAKVD